MPTAHLIGPRTLMLMEIGKQFAKGIATPVSDEEAEVLQDDARFRVTYEKGEDRPSFETSDAAPKRPAAKAKRVAAIQEAIDVLDEDNEDHFTRDGKPAAPALSNVLGWDVSAKDRDEALGIPTRSEPAKAPETAEGGEPKKKGGVTIVKRSETTEDPASSEKGDLSSADIDPTTEGAKEV